MRAVHVVGGGPAGVMVAFAAMREGAGVRIFEKSAFPRHKVCGEFLSPAILPLLRRAGCEAGFLQLRPAVLSAMRLHFGTRVIRHPLPEPAYGVSRYELDRLLLEHAASAGAEVVREHWSAAAQEDTVILADGRKSIAPAGDRLFGFKAHFSGPVNDGVELYFFQNCYVGVSAIENGATNVCGLAPERTLRSFGFHPSDLLERYVPLSERLRPLSRTMDWLVTGPLVFSERLRQPAWPSHLPSRRLAWLHRPLHRLRHPERHAHRRARRRRRRARRIRHVISSRLPSPAASRLPGLFRVPRDHRLRPGGPARLPGPRPISLSRHPPSGPPGPV